MSNRENARERLRSVLISDKAVVPADFCELLKSRLEEVLSDYFDIVPQSLEVDLTAERGSYLFEMHLEADRIRSVGHFVGRK